MFLFTSCQKHCKTLLKCCIRFKTTAITNILCKHAIRSRWIDKFQCFKCGEFRVKMPYYCTVPQCTSLAGRAKDVSFHQFPRDEVLGTQWNSILKRNKPYTKYSKVCSRHFTSDDYTMTHMGKNKGTYPQQQTFQKKPC